MDRPYGRARIVAPEVLMARRRTRSLLPAVLLGAGLTWAATVTAGSMAVVTVTDVPADPPAGEDVALGFTVMQHGETPVSWPTITVLATEASTGDVVRAPSTPEGPTGSYVATIVFPTEGRWTLTFESTDLYMEGSATIRVAPPLAAPVTASSPTATEAAPVVDLAPVIIALALSVILLVVGLSLRGRRVRADGRASART
jgi:hypothetical protein